MNQEEEQSYECPVCGTPIIEPNDCLVDQPDICRCIRCHKEFQIIKDEEHVELRRL